MNIKDLDAIADVVRQGIADAIADNNGILRAEMAENGRVLRAEMPVVKVDEIAKQASALVPDPPTAEQVAEQAAALVPAPKDGENGKDADMDALEERVTASIQPIIAEEVAKIPAPRDGADGKDADPVDPEALAKMVRDEVASIDIKVPAGEPGRDATQIEVLPGIDEDKSYPRGTYASHNGGLWCSYKQTSGMTGWDCIVNGVAKTRIEKADERAFRLCVAQSDGKEITQEYRMPFGIYRGYYKEEENYHHGDFVSRQGSVWHAKCDLPQTAPGMGNRDDWELVVKRGRDGKNGGD